MSITVANSLERYIDNPVAAPVWAPDGRAVAIIEGPPNARQAWRIDLTSGDKTPLFDAERLRKAVHQATGVSPGGEGAPFPQFSFAGPNSIRFAVDGVALIADLDSYAVSPVPGADAIGNMNENSAMFRTIPRMFKWPLVLLDPLDMPEQISPDRQYLLSLQNDNIAIRCAADGRMIMLTDDGTSQARWHIDCLHPAFVSFNGAPAANWSPDSQKIAIYKLDFEGVQQHPRIHNLKKVDEVSFRYGAHAGGVMETHTLHVVDIYGNPPVEIRLGDTRDTYVVAAGWVPDGSELIVFQMRRDCRHIDIWAADPDTGATRLLFSEDGDSPLRNQHALYFFANLDGLTITPDGKDILWLSERDGWKHIYRYGISDGGLKGQLTRGEWPVKDIKAVIDGQVYFTAGVDPQRPYDLHLCRTPMRGGEMEVLTDGAGRHDAIIAPRGNAFLDVRSAVNDPPVITLRDMDGAVLRDKVSETGIRKLEAAGWSGAEEFQVRAADGETDLWGVIIKPFNFNPGCKYPVIELNMSGPTMAYCENGFAALPGSRGASALRFVEQGYVAVIVDPRGTPGRGKAFHDQGYKVWSPLFAEDHVAAMRQLIERHTYMDGDNVGVFAHSWGGMAALHALVQAPDIYKAAVFQQPGLDPYAINLYECWLGMPKDNPEAYRKAACYPLADKVRAEVMILTGTSSHFPWTDAVKMSDALIHAGRNHELVILPEQYQHYAREYQAYADGKTMGFFKRHLFNGNQQEPTASQ